MKKAKPFIKMLNFGIFPDEICFCVGYRKKKLLTQLKKQKYKYHLKAFKTNELDRLFKSGGFVIRNEVSQKKYKRPRFYFLILPDGFDFSDSDISVLLHEIVHLCQFSLDKILDRTQEMEAEAYLHSHIFDQCMKALRKKR